MGCGGCHARLQPTPLVGSTSGGTGACFSRVGFVGYPRNLYRNLEQVAILNREPLMKAAIVRTPLICVAVVESDPLRLVGFRALCGTEPDLELVAASLADLSQLQHVNLVLLANRGGQHL